MPGGELQRWADAHQYRAEPMPEAAKRGPQVTLLNVMPDPLGTLAALCATYSGRVVRNLNELTDEERRKAFEDMTKTILNGPLAGVHLHFLLEGVSRDFTHQAVRDNFSFIAQESLRFAVPEDWAADVPLPPFLAGLAPDDVRVRMWRKAMNAVEDAYASLVNNGVPAEEARGLLPHAILTRYHWAPSLRTLLSEAGKRTCTQAQFHWRVVFGQIAKALREHPGQEYYYTVPGLGFASRSDKWQFELIAKALRPNCFQTGSCGFMAQFDRGCTIRERVERNAKIGRPPSEWGQPLEKDRCIADSDCPGGCGTEETFTVVEAIHDHEWAADPGAARTRPACPRCGGSGRLNWFKDGGHVHVGSVPCPDCTEESK